MMCRKRKKIKNKDLEKVLIAIAKKEAGKYGTDEEMFADVKENLKNKKTL